MSINSLAYTNLLKSSVDEDILQVFCITSNRKQNLLAKNKRKKLLNVEVGRIECHDKSKKEFIVERKRGESWGIFIATISSLDIFVPHFLSCKVCNLEFC